MAQSANQHAARAQWAQLGNRAPIPGLDGVRAGLDTAGT
jgi:hypothetical protein